MKVLLDECLPKKLKFEIEADFVQTVPEAGWAIDFAAHLFAGRRPIGLADYMFDPKIRRSIRAISLFHLWLPPLLMWTVSRLGYDRRALRAQTLATWALLVTTYHVTEPGDDINWVYGLSGSPQHRINPTIYLLLVMAVYPIAFHWPAHVAFTRIFPAPSDINRPCSSATTTPPATGAQRPRRRSPRVSTWSCPRSTASTTSKPRWLRAGSTSRWSTEP